MLCWLSAPLPLFTPHAGIGVPGRPYVTICVSCAREYRSGASCRFGAAHFTIDGRQYGFVVASSSSTFCVVLHRGSVLLTTWVATPPPASGPWQRAQLSDLVLSKNGESGPANNRRPRSTDRSLNAEDASVSRNGSQTK